MGERPTAHYGELDGLRGLLAFCIVLLHYGVNALIMRASHGMLNGVIFELAVDFFFILSGFVLAGSLTRKPIGLISFAFKRAVRLLPVYYVTLAAMIGLAFLTPASVPYLAVPLDPARTLADLFVVPPMFEREALNVPAWSVTWELFLPVAGVALAPLATGVLFRRHARIILPVLLIGLSVTSALVAARHDYQWARAALGLSAGAALAHAHREGLFQSLKMASVAIYLAVAAMFAVMLAAAAMPLAALLFPWIAAFAVIAGTRSRTLLSSPPAVWLGSISYTLYMVHIPVFVATTLLVGDLSGSVVGKAGAILASLAVAQLLTIVIEKPLLAVGRRAMNHDGKPDR